MKISVTIADVEMDSDLSNLMGALAVLAGDYKVETSGAPSEDTPSTPAASAPEPSAGPVGETSLEDSVAAILDDLGFASTKTARTADEGRAVLGATVYSKGFPNGAEVLACTRKGVVVATSASDVTFVETEGVYAARQESEDGAPSAGKPKDDVEDAETVDESLFDVMRDNAIALTEATSFADVLKCLQAVQPTARKLSELDSSDWKGVNDKLKKALSKAQVAGEPGDDVLG